jgi:uncharacterized membrane protein
MNIIVLVIAVACLAASLILWEQNRELAREANQLFTDMKITELKTAELLKEIRRIKDA